MNHRHQLLSSIQETYFSIYPHNPHNETTFQSFLNMIQEKKVSRMDALKKADQSLGNWHLQPDMVGVSLYVDLFAIDLKNFKKKADYFVDLGIKFIHLMPLLKPRPGNNDGGYAVMDYKDIDPRLGTWEDFKEVIACYRAANIHLAIDFVVNHTAKEHEWALKAAEGDPFYQDFYLMYDTDEIPNLYNQTVPEVLPDIYPGNFTYYPSFKKYVFTSFSEFQWDLNLANPLVLHELIDIFLFMANLGIQMIRLDAIPFLWKSLYTTCRNLPMAHTIIHLFQLVKEYVCPSVLILGEAIVEPHEIVKYFGSDQAIECEVLYNATHMVNVWNTLATRDVSLLQADNQRFSLPKHAIWMNYLRCHDDIGWGFNESFVQSVGWNPFEHKQFLISFYNGSFPGTFARGKNYQYNELTKDARTNGTLASLIGFEKAKELHDSREAEISMHRFMLLHAYLFCQDGMPLIFSGDELLQPNDYDHGLDESKSDGRWIHRPAFPWEMLQSPHNIEPMKAYAWIKHLIQLRKDSRYFGPNATSSVISSPNLHVYIMTRTNQNQTLLALFNFSDFPQMVSIDELPCNITSEKMKDQLVQKYVQTSQKVITMHPYEALWLEKIK